MLILVLFIALAVFMMIRGRKSYILFFMAFYPVLPDYFGIELSRNLPLLKASRILLLLLIFAVLLYNKKIRFLKRKAKDMQMFWPLYIYFLSRIIANAYYVPFLSEAINTEFTIIVEQLMLLFFLRQIIKTKEDVLECVNILVEVSALIAIISIVNVFLGSNIFYNLNTISRNVLMTSMSRMGIIRAEATFGHPVYYGMYCALIIPLAFYKWQNSRNGYKYGIICLLDIIAALLTESRGTIVILLALMLITFIFVDTKTKQRLVMSALGVSILSVVAIVMIPEVMAQFSNIFKSVLIAFSGSDEMIADFGGNLTTGLSSRFIQLSGIWWMLMHNPMFGLGASCHMRGELRYFKDGRWVQRATIDNGYVGYFVQEGLIGAIGFFSLLVGLLKNTFRLSNFKDKANLNNIFFLCFLSYAGEMLSVADNSQLFWIIITLFISYNEKDRKDRVLG